MKSDFETKPCFHISVVSEMLGLHPQTIRNYEKVGLIKPSRTEGNVRLFSPEDVEKLRKINSFTRIGVNLAGVEIIMKLLDQIEQLEQQLDREIEQSRRKMEQETKMLRNRIGKLDDEV